MNYKQIGIIVVIGLLISAGVYLFLNSPQFKLFRAEGFMDSLWVEDLQLYKEAPSSNKAWIKPDNYIMNYFKEDRPRTQDPDINPNKWQGRIEVISGEIPSLPLADIDVLFVESAEGYDTYTEIEGDVMPDWMEYADLRGYACLSSLKRYDYMGQIEDLTEALRYLREFSLLWDGQGFNDKAFTAEGKYAVNNNAMYVYCVKLLDKVSKVESDWASIKDSTAYRDVYNIFPDVESMLWRAQDPGSGGFHTHYVSGKIVGDMNAETTAWVLLAYEWLVSDSSFGI